MDFVEKDVKDSLITELNLKVLEYENDIQQLHDKIEILQDMVSKFDNQRKTDVEVLKKSSFNIREANERIKDLEAQVMHAIDEKDFASTQLRVVRQKIKEYAISLENAENERSDFEIELRVTKEKLKKAQRGDGNTITKEVSDLERQLDMAKEQIKRLEEKCEVRLA